MGNPTEFDPIPDDLWPEAVADLLPGFAGKINVYRVMAHHPELLRAWAPLRAHIVTRTSLGPERAEVVILRAGMRLGSAYEWSQHVLRARKVGLTDARIASLKGPLDGMLDADALLCRAVDKLFDSKALPPEMLRDLLGAVGRKGVLDLVATVGFYTTLGFILNSFGVPLDDDAATELEKHPMPA